MPTLILQVSADSAHFGSNVGAVADISAVQLPRQERTPDDYEDSVGNPKQWRSSRPLELANVGCATKRPPRYDANIGDPGRN